MTFEGVDYFGVDEELTEEERLVRDNVRRFVDKEVSPVIGAHYQAGTFPEDLIPKFADLGLLGANLEGYGCAGMGEIAYGLAMQELERGDSGVRSFCSVQGALCMYPIHAFGSEAQKERWLPRMAEGKAIGCFGLTEPDFGSNPSGMLTAATSLPDGGSDAVLMAAQVLNALDYVGVLGIEIFVTPAGLVVNEFAPRVHNSGHWTQTGCLIDQFEQHIRAIAGWPLGDGTRHCDVEMENLIGADIDRIPEIAATGAAIHLYGKAEARPGRKMGHVNRVTGPAT